MQVNEQNIHTDESGSTSLTTHSDTEPIRPSRDVPTPQDTRNEPSSPTHRIGEVLSTIGVLLLAVLIAFVLTVYVFQSYQVEGPSMQNTLHNNNRLIVWKLPRTWARITGHQYVPKRGDIIVFTESGLSNYGDSQDTKQLIKRVIGLPGDHIVIKNGAITIYNKKHPHGFDPDTTLPYGRNGAIPQTSGNINITLGRHQLFVCGDNRPDSLDSRIFGPINTSQVIGKLVVRIYPFSQIEKF